MLPLSLPALNLNTLTVRSPETESHPGPNEFDPASYSWGGSALLVGPDPARLTDALTLGNQNGFTDRLDYVERVFDRLELRQALEQHLGVGGRG